jgi:hypothetical protein
LAIGTAKLLAEPIGLRALFFIAFLLDDIDQRVSACVYFMGKSDVKTQRRGMCGVPRLDYLPVQWRSLKRR